MPGLPAVEHVVEDARPPGVGEELGAEPDEPPRRNLVVEAHPARPVIDHFEHGALAQRQQLGDHTEILVGHVHADPLHRLVDLAVDLTGDDLRLADGELETLPPHRLDQDGQLELAAAEHFPHVGALGRGHPDGHVADELCVQAGFEQAGGQFVPS